MRTIIVGAQPSRIRPERCNDRGFLPSSGFLTTVTIKREDFGTFQVVITAGQGKLNGTQGASASGSSPTITGSASEAVTGPGNMSTGTPANGQSTAAAMPMRTMAPMVAGLGAAVSIFVG